MSYPLEQLRQRLKRLRAYMAALEFLDAGVAKINLLCELPDEALSKEARTLAEQLPTNQSRQAWFRQLNYSSVVVSLFATFETFVEEQLQDYLRKIIRLDDSYFNLPEVVRRAHATLSIDLMSRLEQTRFKQQLSIEGLISNLHGCNAGLQPYSLNEEAFVYHAVNFRSSALNEFFLSRVGVSVFDHIKKTATLKEFLESRGDIVLNEFAILNDLVERRNEVAHGVPSELLDIALMVSYSDYISTLSGEISDALESDYLRLLAHKKGKHLGLPEIVYNDIIACFKNLALSVSIGDIIIAKSPAGIFKSSSVKSLQINQVEVDSVTAIDGRGVGVGLDMRVKDNYEFFVVYLLAGEVGSAAEIKDPATEGGFVDERDGEIIEDSD